MFSSSSAFVFLSHKILQPGTNLQYLGNVHFGDLSAETKAEHHL